LYSQGFGIPRIRHVSLGIASNEDEDSNIDICLLNLNDKVKCLTNENESIRRSSLKANQYDCSNRLDEYFDLDGLSLYNKLC
jgi:hypothetical protein